MKARPAGTESVITSTGYGAGGNAAGVVCIYRHRSETIHRGGERPAIISEGRLVIVEIQVQCAIALRCETAAGSQLDVALAAGAELRLDGSIDNIGVRRAAHFTAEIGPPTPIAVRGLTGPSTGSSVIATTCLSASESWLIGSPEVVLTKTTLLIPGTWIGMLVELIPDTPSSPADPSPQLKSRPSPVTAKLKSTPAAIATTFDRIEGGICPGDAS